MNLNSRADLLILTSVTLFSLNASSQESIQSIQQEQTINLTPVELRKTFTDQKNEQIVAFLKTLAGEQPTFALPILPASTDKTPQPEPFG